MSVDLKMTQVVKLPKPVYDRAPWYWLLLGLILIVVGLYLGLQKSMHFLYLGGGGGLGAVAWSIWIFSRRRIRPTPEKTRRPSEIDDPDLDQTCELNYRPD